MVKLTIAAIYPGSFDPITNGHFDVLTRASKLFDYVIIAVINNPSKKSFLAVNDRIKLIKESVKEIKNVEIDCFDGLTVDYAKQKGARILIRGLRAVSDFEHEMQMAQTNKILYPELETLFLVPSAENNFISSSIVREIALLGGDISNIVPEPVNNFFITINKAR